MPDRSIFFFCSVRHRWNATLRRKGRLRDQERGCTHKNGRCGSGRKTDWFHWFCASRADVCSDSKQRYVHGMGASGRQNMCNGHMQDDDTVVVQVYPVAQDSHHDCFVGWCRTNRTRPPTLCFSTARLLLQQLHSVSCSPRAPSSNSGCTVLLGQKRCESQQLAPSP